MKYKIFNPLIIASLLAPTFIFTACSVPPNKEVVNYIDDLDQYFNYDV